MDADRKRRTPAPTPEPSGTPTPVEPTSSVASPVWASEPVAPTAGSEAPDRERASGQRMRVSPKEQAAEALAEKALRDPPPKGALQPLQPPKGPADIEVGAVALPGPVRRAFERRFGRDLSGVRLRESDQTAGALGSQAFAVGRVIAFAPGAFDPDGERGRELIAHELAHVVLSESEPATMASQKTPGAPLFYQDVQDQFDAAFGLHELALRPIANLCQIVEAERAAEVKKAVDGLAAVDTSILPPDLPSTATASELVARISLLGLPEEAVHYLNWQVKLPGVIGPRPTSGPRFFDTESWYWESALETLKGKVDWLDSARAGTVLDAYLGLIPLMKKQRDQLDPQQIKDDEARLAGDTSPSGYGFGLQSGPYLSISRWNGKLADLMRRAFIDAQDSVQSLMDLAVADLQAGKGPGKLDDLAKRLATMGNLSLPPVQGIEINDTIFETKAGKESQIQVDAFPAQPGSKTKRIKIENYDVNLATTRPTQELNPSRMLAIRLSQVDALRKIYGVERVGGVLTPEAAENAAALTSLGPAGLRLNSDDDWRTFLSAKLNEQWKAKASPADAFGSLVNLLMTYLRAFTTHTPLNIDDFGDNLLKQDFPRALTGQLVHDCGVYALRIAYMLSLVRDDPALKLRFRFIQLPVHIGLIITSDTAPIGAYIIHNDAVTPISDAELVACRSKWDLTDETGLTRTTALPHDKKSDEQFLGELAAEAFVRSADLPFVISDVPALPGRTAADATRNKATLWAAYQKTLKNKLFGKASDDPNDPAYQFHLRYLNVLELAKKHHNDYVVKLWNQIGHPAWKASVAALTKADTKRSSTKPDEQAAGNKAFNEARTAYLRTDIAKVGTALEDAFLTVKGAYLPVEDAAHAVTNDIDKRPEIIAPGASRARSERIVEIDALAHPWWEIEIAGHIGDLKKGLLNVPRYADDKSLLRPVD